MTEEIELSGIELKRGSQVTEVKQSGSQLSVTLSKYHRNITSPRHVFDDTTNTTSRYLVVSIIVGGMSNFNLFRVISNILC